jgi:beta-lactamase class A
MRTVIALALVAAASTSACQRIPVNLVSQFVTQSQGAEQSTGGRLGVALVDQYESVLLEHRGDERFAFCSTFKLFLAGMALDGSRAGAWSLDDPLPVAKADLVSHSPVVETLVDRGSIPMGEAARAAVVLGDNTAANLLIAKMGGISAFNDWMKRHFDGTTHLDRLETDLNQNLAGDRRDTSTPRQIARSAAGLVLGHWLPDGERQVLRNWLVESTTGLDRIRAGLPAGWIVGDKTGTCGGAGRGSYNDLAFLLPNGSKGEGYVLAVYLDDPKVGEEQANAAIASIARASVAAISSKQGNPTK